MLVDDVDLKRRIDAWVAERRAAIAASKSAAKIPVPE
jgi:hypothetical protein